MTLRVTGCDENAICLLIGTRYLGKSACLHAL